MKQPDYTSPEVAMIDFDIEQVVLSGSVNAGGREDFTWEDKDDSIFN